jgi:hypothetical protein
VTLVQPLEEKVKQSFEGIYRLHLQCQKVRLSRSYHEAGSKQSLLYAGFLPRPQLNILVKYKNCNGKTKLNAIVTYLFLFSHKFLEIN